MIKIKKCRSRKHSSGGCGNPRCPEGLSIKAALEEAVQKHDLNSFLQAREMTEARPSYMRTENGMRQLFMTDADKSAVFSYPANRPNVVEQIKKIDKTSIPSFETVDDLQNHLNDLYRPYAHVRIREETDSGRMYKNSFGLKRLGVGDMQVDADVRGLGVGRHMRATILKFADEHNYAVTGTPTEGGDGTMTETDTNHEEYKAHCLAHKARLEKFYLDSGYEYNYACIPFGKNFWTGEPYPENKKWEKKLHPAAASFLRNSGFFIRWPNNEVPENWKAGATPVGKDA